MRTVKRRTMGAVERERSGSFVFDLTFTALRWGMLLLQSSCRILKSPCKPYRGAVCEWLFSGCTRVCMCMSECICSFVGQIDRLLCLCSHLCQILLICDPIAKGVWNDRRKLDNKRQFENEKNEKCIVRLQGINCLIDKHAS